MRCSIVLLACVGCGSVASSDHKDAPTTKDSPASCGTEHSTPQSCGATCAVCPGTAGRQVATCDGTSCGIGCVDNAPTCSDGTCSKLVWTFDDGTLDGVTPRAPNTLVLAVRPHLGSMAIAMDITNLNTELQFTMPICTSGMADVSAKTLSADVYYEDTAAPTGDQYYVQASTPQPVTGAYIGQSGVAANMTKTISFPMSGSSMSNATTTLVWQAGSFGAAFNGTIWFDNIKIQ